MTNKQPEMSVEEIVEEFYQHSVQSVPSLDDGQRASLKLKVKQIVQAERQKREEMVARAKAERDDELLKLLDKAVVSTVGNPDLEAGYIQCLEQLKEHLTQPNNPKVWKTKNYVKKRPTV